MITVIGSYNSSLLSKFIRFASKDPVSHFAICFDDKLIFHATVSGAKPVFRSTFLKDNTIHTEIKLPNLTLEKEEMVWQLCTQFDGRPYDVAALLYFFIYGATHIFDENPFPKHNPWNHKDMYICNEIAYTLNPVMNLELDLSTKTPWQVLNKIRETLS